MLLYPDARASVSPPVPREAIAAVRGEVDFVEIWDVRAERVLFISTIQSA